MGAVAEFSAAVDVAAGLGHNHPPAPSPFEAFTAHIGDLFEEAKNFLDGEGVNSEGEAEAVAKLLDLIRTAAKDADKARAEEKKPHDDAGKAVQSKWKPLLERADLAVTTCKNALTPWLQKKEAERVAQAEAARAEAQRKADEAAAAIAAASVTDLEAQEQAEALLKDAKKAETAAAKVENSRAQAAGGARAVSLRTTYRPTLESPSKALRHYASERPAELKAFLLTLAETDVRAGKHEIPGFTVTSEQVAV